MAVVKEESSGGPVTIGSEVHVEMKDQSTSDPREETFTTSDSSKAKKRRAAERAKKKLSARETIDTIVLMLKIGGLNWIRVCIGCVFQAFTGIMPLIFYLIFGDILNVFMDNTLTRDQVYDQLIEVVWKMFVVAASAGVAQLGSNSFILPAGQRIAIKFRAAFFNKTVMQEIGFFDANRTGELISKLSEDIAVIESVLTEKIGLFCQHTTQFIAGIIMAFVYSWKMTLVTLSVAPLVVIGFVMQSTVIAKSTKKISDLTATSMASAEEVVGSFRTVRAFASEKREADRYKNDLKRITYYAIFKGLIHGFANLLISFSLWGSCALAFWYGGKLVIDDMAEDLTMGSFTIGDMIRVFGVMLMGVLGMSQAMTTLAEFSKATISAHGLFEVVKREPRVNFEGGKKLDKIVGKIEFVNTRFRYPTRPNAEVLKGANIVINPGETVALVGSSGSGKSTIISLIERFYDPSEGSVLLDDVDIRELDPVWLHQQIGIVTQEPVLFATTIEENIKYGREDATDEEVQRAAKMANAHDFIVGLEHGYKTKVGERGASLSGGQKQRIAIARAILKDPRILLLDEATSALDTESEALVKEALDRLMQGRTSVVVAHRLSTIQNADRIIVMRYGTIVEEGKHEELIKKEGGEYQKLAKRQMLSAGDEHEEKEDEGESDEEGSESETDK